jgi:hypothetical protein
MAYNLLKYPNNASTRNEHFARVIESINPDLIVCPEMFSQSGVNQFLSTNLSDEYIAYPFKDENGTDTDNAVFYKDSLISIINYRGITATPRKISEYTVVHKSTFDTLIVYGVHLKASKGEDNESLRYVSAMRVRFFTDKFHPGTNFMVLGDFNIYRSSEPAFQKFLEQDNTGYFIDPLDEPGDWNNNSTFRHIFTQSTRSDNLPDGGSSGGMDDRFDMILVSESLMDSTGIYYVPDSYTAYGNDGKHFNISINVQPNDAVSPDVANSLYYASDHLPVYADFVFAEVTDVIENEYLVRDFKLLQNYPNPFNPATTIKYTIPANSRRSAVGSIQIAEERSQKSEKYFQSSNQPVRRSSTLSNLAGSINQSDELVQLKIYDILGREVAVLVNEYKPPGEYEVKFNAGNLTSGVYFYRLSAGKFSAINKMLLLR